ncbi:MAG: class I SAM-dependent methyltransferase [Acidobacteriota bacterium]|nr:class I SAM-dependent methyltransferase [Acidobacteriota bacterium]
MTNYHTHQGSDFDSYAAEYDEALAKGISVSGEDRDFFARGRIEWLANCLRTMGEQPTAVMDFGCGTGSSLPFFVELVKIGSFLGIDTSAKSLEEARRRYVHDSAHFALISEHEPDGNFDLAFCNGVFHHIPVAERGTAVGQIYRSLRPGGLFAFWENNPWNPGTRYVMSRIPFDRDAIMVRPAQARMLLSTGGFEIVSTDFLFVFPRVLRWLRRMEPFVSHLPFGAQYQILCRKPG